MIFNTNRWRRLTYTLWAPGYDRLAGFLQAKRARSLSLLHLQPGERVLIIGAGTGLDLPMVEPACSITAIDLTPAMVKRLRARASHLAMQVDARVMDAHKLEFPDSAFDVVILHFIVAAIPDPVRCLQEAARVLRPGGRGVILDKFVPDERQPTLLQRIANPVALFLATSVTRKLGPILAQTSFRVTHDEPAGMGGFFRIVLVEKAAGPTAAAGLR